MEQQTLSSDTIDISRAFPIERISSLFKRNTVYDSIIPQDLLLQIRSFKGNYLISGERGTGRRSLIYAGLQLQVSIKESVVEFDCALPNEQSFADIFFGSEIEYLNDSTRGIIEQVAIKTIIITSPEKIPQSAQSDFINLFKNKQYYRQGGERLLFSNVRFIIVVDEAISESLTQNAFLLHLYSINSNNTISLLPLCQQNQRVKSLAYYYLNQYSKIYSKSITAIDTDGLTILRNYSWPGNISELRNCIERSVILETGSSLSANNFQYLLPNITHLNAGNEGTLREVIKTIEIKMIVGSLQRSKGNMSKSAQELGITDRIMNLRVKRYGIKYKEFRV